MIRITTNSPCGCTAQSHEVHQLPELRHDQADDPAAVQLLCVESRRGHPGLQNSQFPNATNAQYSNNDTVLHKYETAWSTLESVLDGYDGLVQDTGRVPPSAA